MTLLLTHAEAKARLRCGKNKVYELAREREISITRIGRKVFFPEEGIEAFLRRNTVLARRQFLSHSRHS